MAHPKAYTRMVAEAKARFNKANGSFVAFTIYLRRIELAGTWRLPEYTGFGDFLSAEFPTNYDEKKYRYILRAIEIYGEDFMLKVGQRPAYCMTTDGFLSCTDAVATLKKWCNIYFSSHGVMPAYETVKGYTKRIMGQKGKPPREAQREDELRVLRSENKRLRQENSALKAKVALLTSKLRTCRARVKQLASEASVRGSKSSRSTRRAK